ncbi:hypothetical protein LDENG_00121480 [Lucifuga dentata]|nr:hypothetical protein LDENG_00121480 [Lucifuga dentata]
MTTVQHVAVIVEEDVILQDLPDLTTALADLMALIYALNLQYSKELRDAFERIHKVFMELGTERSGRVQSFQTKLLL